MDDKTKEMLRTYGQAIGILEGPEFSNMLIVSQPHCNLGEPIRTTIRKVGSSIGIILNKKVADFKGLVVGAEVDVYFVLVVKK